MFSVTLNKIAHSKTWSNRSPIIRSQLNLRHNWFSGSVLKHISSHNSQLTIIGNGHLCEVSGAGDWFWRFSASRARLQNLHSYTLYPTEATGWCAKAYKDIIHSFSGSITPSLELTDEMGASIARDVTVSVPQGVPLGPV